MIHSKDRSGWFGASDTSIICGNWNTKTFERWWMVKLGLIQDNFSTVHMMTGTALEHRILSAAGIKKMDRQIRIRKFRLRVNLDGESDIIHEVKTYGGDSFRLTKPYWQQAQVEMFAAKKPLEILAYKLLPEDYENWFLPIDLERMTRVPVQYDSEWIESIYLPRVLILKDCLLRGILPEA